MQIAASEVLLCKFGEIHQWFPWDFPNGVFQFMSKLKFVVNIIWQYFDILL